jgi:DNA-binding response OmpR family regulator
LVVDDDPGILSGLTRFLQRDGHTVQTATDGHSVAERSFSLLDRLKMLIKPMAQPLLRNSR